MNDTILAIDIGSTKICAIIAERIANNKLEIIGHGISKSQGIKKGIIVNIEHTSRAIRQAVDDAKRISGSDISSAIVSISNAYTKSISSTGIVNIPHKDIGINEINRVLNTAIYNADIPSEYDIIHVLPYNFKVDDQNFIEDPFGMHASRIEAEVNIIMTQKTNLANLKKAAKSAAIAIEDIVLNGYASSIATMEEDDKELGVAVIDLGGQTSTIAVCTGKSIRYSEYFGVGSNHITNDLSIALHTPLNVAENIKIQHGNLSEYEDGTVELPIIGDDHKKSIVSNDIIHDVIFARAEETLIVLEQILERSGLKDKIGSGIILTGGSTNLKGTRELAQSIFSRMAVRVAGPNTSSIIGMFDELHDSAYSAVIGLLLYKTGHHVEYEINFNQQMLHSKSEFSDSLSNIKIDSTMREVTEQRSNKKTSSNNIGQHNETKTNSILSDTDYGFMSKTAKKSEDINSSLNKMVIWLKQIF